MAIWFPLKAPAAATPSSSQPPQRPSASLHFNLWRFGHRGHEKDEAATPDLLDVGIMVASPGQLAEISIYVPIKIGPEHIADLGALFSDGTLATGIFNESLTATNGPSHSVIILKKASGDTYCGVVKFPRSNNQIAASHLKFRHEFDGTIITITSTALAMGVSGIAENDSLYFRLRLTIPKSDSITFINAAIPNDKFLTSGVDVTEYLDFRLNQARNLNTGIAQQMTDAGWPKAVPTTRLDFLLVVGVAVDVVVGHPAFHKCRLLETDLWKSYVDKTHLQKGMVIYHWKDDPKNDPVVDFNAFVKLRLRLSDRKIITRYFIIALLIGISVGVFGNTVYDTGKFMFWKTIDMFRSTSAATTETQVACPPSVGKIPSEPPGG
ncbi:hypothetical protein [Azospirillum argentinense]|uniref:hypothetical protein n=1 Tax=Azospirillum argentinense TaxID=2970906 RepID=UPI0010C0EC69|nr:hypothetical protein [Azospirillum argentinense]